jgi:peptide/nickel transport system ATP-binding protein
VRLELRDVTVRYGSGDGALTAVDRIDLDVPERGTLGLVGESGCGKSTLARALVGLVPIAGGTVRLDGDDVTPARARGTRAFRRRVQLIFQDPYSSLNPRMRVGDALAEAVAQRGVRRSLRAAEALRLLDLVGLPRTALERYPHQFSGGQRQRVAIARALAVGPELVINDEVTSALDVSVQANILNLLRDLQRELGLSYVFISHDLSTVRYMSDAVAVMYLGTIVENAATDELFRAPRHPYTQALIASIPRLGQARRSAPLPGELPDPRHPPAGCRFHTRCPIGPLVRPDRTICLEIDPQTIATTKEHRAACHFAGDAQPVTSAAVAI